MAKVQSAYRLVQPAIKYLRERLVSMVYPSHLEYAPKGWETALGAPETSGWNDLSVVAAEKERWDVFSKLVKGSGPLGFSHEHTDLTSTRNISFHNVHITYGYVLALAAHQKTRLSVLDYGGGLGHYYLLGKTLLPEVELEFHCKEMPQMAEAGKILNPEIQWFTDDSCLNKTFDLVMISGSLQYIEHWQDFLHAVSSTVGEYLFLTRVPVIEKHDSFVAIQKSYDTAMLHWQFNRGLLLRTIEKEGYGIVREFVIGDRPYIKGAPEQCELLSWLFRKII
jgi:putative methyltransferase (TIGR04325 family)